MKNKRAEQIATKQAHKQALKLKRRSEPVLNRAEPVLDKKPLLLIYCEGKNTEPSYFNQFRLPSVDIHSFGEGRNTLSLVERALELSQENSYDQVWCVFDADPKPGNSKQAENFNKAIKFAEKHDLKIAYSNQAFEYWLILHFEDHQGGSMNRNDYSGKLNNYLRPFRVKYDGDASKIIHDDFFEILDGVDSKTKVARKQLAIKRAERIYNNLDHSNPAKNESSTSVFKLVQELLKYT